MSSSGSMQHCRVLLISSDMEWNHAYLSALKRLFVVEEQVCEQSWQVNDMIRSRRPDVLVLRSSDAEASMMDIKQAFEDNPPRIPVIAVVDERGDPALKAGADLYVQAHDILAALQYTRRVMQDKSRQLSLDEAQSKAQMLQELNHSLYRDAPDPICFVQDGLFMDANTAFLSTFDIASTEELNELTLLSLTSPRSSRELKVLLRMVATKGLTSAETLDMQTPSGEKRKLVCTASQVVFRGESAIQLQWRGENSGGGAVSADKTTGLMGFSALHQAIEHERETHPDAETLGIWTYLWVENYREIWVQDGYKAAEILMGCVAEGVARYMPSSTIAVRFNDDGLIMFAHGEREAAIERIESLITQVSKQVPENIGRMIHPSLYAAVEVVTPKSNDMALLSSTFRAVRSLSLGQNSERVATGGSSKISRNDERRLTILQSLLDNNRIEVKYQPINHLEADGQARFAMKLDFTPTSSDDSDDIELNSLISIAERNGRGKALDELKINAFCRDILSYDGDQHAINGFVTVGSQSLKDETFADWVLSQLKQTGVAPSQLNFEITLDVALNVFSDAMQFANKVRQAGAHIVLAELTRFDEEVQELATRLKPDILKLDMREIDTFEDEEEERFMTTIKDYAEKNGQTIIVDHMESPAQLSRVWPYDLQLLQGDGMVSALDDFHFDFSEPLF